MPGDTKSALLDSAERAIRSRGFDGFSYADLSREVGITKASIHHHFPTKAALSVALMERYGAYVETACAGIDATHDSGAARLEALIQFYRTAIDGGTCLCLCVSFSISRESLPAEVVVQVSQFRNRMTRWIQSAFEAGLADGSIADVADPEVEASAMLPLLEGAQLAARAQQDAGLFDLSVRLLMKRF